MSRFRIDGSFVHTHREFAGRDINHFQAGGSLDGFALSTFGWLWCFIAAGQCGKEQNEKQPSHRWRITFPGPVMLVHGSKKYNVRRGSQRVGCRKTALDSSQTCFAMTAFSGESPQFKAAVCISSRVKRL